MQFNKVPLILSIIAALTLSACSKEKHPAKGAKVAPWVKTVALKKA